MYVSISVHCLTMCVNETCWTEWCGEGGYALILLAPLFASLWVDGSGVLSLCVAGLFFSLVLTDGVTTCWFSIATQGVCRWDNLLGGHPDGSTG